MNRNDYIAYNWLLPIGLPVGLLIGLPIGLSIAYCLLRVHQREALQTRVVGGRGQDLPPPLPAPPPGWRRAGSWATSGGAGRCAAGVLDVLGVGRVRVLWAAVAMGGAWW